MDGTRLEQRAACALRDRRSRNRHLRPAHRRTETSFDPHSILDTAGLRVFVIRLVYRLGLSRDADLIFDMRFRDNPFISPGRCRRLHPPSQARRQLVLQAEEAR